MLNRIITNHILKKSYKLSYNIKTTPFYLFTSTKLKIDPRQNYYEILKIKKSATLP
jgi:hypothetical protein